MTEQIRRVVVTGGAGFIGSHVADACLAAGHEVLVLDDLSTGTRGNVPGGAEFVQGDIRDGNTLREVFAGFRPHWVSHQAAQTSVAVSTRLPIEDAEANVLGTIQVLLAAREHGVENLVLASTGGAIYGEVPDGERAGRTWSPRPMSPYACSKFAAEQYVRAEVGLETTVLRYANVYGPRQDPHGEAGVVAIFCRNLLAGESCQINAMKQSGDDGCIRDYVYVGDVVRANLAALRGEIDMPILDIGSGMGTSTKVLVEALAEAVGVEVQLTYAAIRTGDLKRSVLDPRDFEERLGPTTPLVEGMADTVDWFRHR